MKTIFVNETNLNIVQQSARACVIALGFFDGVHLGHEKVIMTAKAEAKRRGLPLALMSFPTHPMNVLSNGKQKIGNLMTLNAKQQRLQQLGVEVFYLVEFTKTFANLSPAEFVSQYLIGLGVNHAVAGFDYHYGKMGAGNLSDIPTYSNNQISISEVECIDYKGEKISSTVIRQCLERGLVHEIPNYLGHSYHSKAIVNNHSITILGDTMLPTYGQYHVLLIQHNNRFSVEIDVKQYGKIQCLQFPELQGEVSIEWLEYNTSLQITNIS